MPPALAVDASRASNSPPERPWLLTPGPLTTSATVKAAMLRDWGSRDSAFIAMTARVRERLLQVAGALPATATTDPGRQAASDAAPGDEAGYTCVLLQGSGTFAVEATLGTLIPPDGKALVLVNGAYGERMASICARHGRAVATLDWPQDRPVEAATLDARLAADASITHVLVVHCETTTGILNPVEAVARVCTRHGRALLIDAMSSFGALPLDLGTLTCDALMASSNKCLEGVPGLGFAIVRRAALAGAADNAPALSLDLHAQWRGFEGNGQWRFTPPTQVLAALDQALVEHAAEGGVAGRGARYRDNCRVLVAGLRALGFETLLPDALQAPIIVTFHQPADPAFDFQRFYDALAARGFLVYPGKLTVADSFRIGCIGHLDEAVMQAAVQAVADTLRALGVASAAAPRSDPAQVPA